MRKILFCGFINAALVVFITIWTKNLLPNRENETVPFEIVVSDEHMSHQLDDDFFERIKKNILNDVKYFPVAESTNRKMEVSFSDSWMSERTYGGTRGHEGTDIIASVNKRNIYPIVSMSDGTVTKKGWLEKGGYRIGITTKNGIYFYYAHLSGYADIEVGDTVKAGDLLGFMGDSGYGPEGTVGQFVVHLHLGIYVNVYGKEVSLNPYWILRYIENKTVKCYTEI